MTADEFLNEIARQNLVPAEIIDSLRRQVAKSAKPVAPQTLAKLLVDKGHTTAAQSQRVLGVAAPAAPAPAAAKKAAPAALEPLGSGDPLGLADLDDLLTPAAPAPPARPAAAPAATTPKTAASAAKPAAPAKPAAAPAKPPPGLDDLSLTPLDDLLGPAPAQPAAPVAPAAKPAAKAAAAPAKPGPAKAPAAPAPAAKAKAPSPLQDLQPLGDLEPLGEAAPLDLSSGGDLFAAPASAGGVATATADPFASATAVAATAAADPFAQPAAAAAGAAPAKPARKSSGMLGIIIGLVVVLVIAVGTAVAFVLIPRDTGDKEFAAAEQDYQAKQFAAAIEKYDAALQRYPHSPHAGPAKVHRAMARLNTAASSKTDWPAILTAAKEVLPPIAAEPELSQLHAEIAPLLTDTADGLTTLASKAKTPEETAARVAQAREALNLTSDARLVPGSLRQWQRLASAEELLAVVEYSAKRSAALDAAVAKIKEAAGGKPDAAYSERNQLLLAYPDLATSAPLRDAMQQVSQAEAARITAVEEKTNAETTEAAGAIVASMAFATPLATVPAGAPGRRFFVAASGSVWAFDGPSGKLLWRRACGSDSSAGPVPVSADADSDLLIVDAATKSVQRVASATGALVWRRSFESPIAGAPVVMGANVVVTTRSGRVLSLDAASGNVAATVQLPRACRVSAAIAASGNIVYQLADHSHLFALSAVDLKCAGVAYVGHEPAAVLVPPQVVGQHLIVADNAGAGDATLHVVALKDDGVPQGVVQRVDVPGQVLTPPVVLGKHLVVITDRGANVALRITTDRSAPLERLNEVGARADQPVARYGLPLGEKLLVAGDGLRLDALDASSGNFQPTWTAFAGEALLAPPQLTGDVLFCARRDLTGGNIAAAVQASTGKPLWQTRFAVSLAAGALPDASGQATMIATAHGEIAKLDEASWQGPSIHSFAAPAANQPALPRIAGGLRLASGDVVLFPASGASQLLVAPADGAALRSVPLPGPLAAAPLLMGERILAVCSSGDVVLLNPATGAALADPLQIPISPGQGLKTCSLAALGELSILADGSNSLRQLGVEQGPPPHLVEQAAAKLTAPSISPVAALGQHAFVVDRTGELRSFQLPGLTPAESFKLGAETIVFGPERVGEFVLLATDRDELWCIGAGPKQLWTIPLTRGPLAGSPLAAGDSLILATRSGALTRIAASTGKEVANLDLGQSLARTPAAVGQFVLVPAADGTLLKVKLPAEGAASP